MENGGSRVFSGRESTQRTCLDIVEVVMDDGEVISRREISLNSVKDFGEFGGNVGEFGVKTAANENGRFELGSIPVPSGNYRFERVRGADSNWHQNGLKRKAPGTVNVKTSGTLVKTGVNSVDDSNLSENGGNPRTNNVELPENQTKGSKNEDFTECNLGVKLPVNAEAVGDYLKSSLNRGENCKEKVVNLKLSQNQTVNCEYGVNALPKNYDENDVSRQPENCRPANFESEVNGMNLRQPKYGLQCQAMENGVNALNLRQLKEVQKCFMDVESGALNLRQPKNARTDVGKVNSSGGIPLGSPVAEPQPKCPSAEWGEARGVKEELFRGLGLVPRGVLHDNGRPVDRRHCVTGRRTVQADSELAERGPAEVAERPRNVFYPSGVPTMFDTEKFIGEIQTRPAIYDVRSKVYSNRVAKLKYWHEVGKEMYKGWEDLDQMERRSLVKELQIKWKSIRDHFMRQLKQNINGEGPKKKKYVHFDQLQFLTANLGVKRRWQPWKQNWDYDAENSMSGSGYSRVKEEPGSLKRDPLRLDPEPRHSYKLPKQEPEEEYMEFTPELPEERHFSFVTSVERADYDEREVPVAALLPTPQPEDLSYHKEPLYYHHQDLSYHKELEGDRMGNKMFLLSLLPIMERLPDHANIRARLQLMEVLQAFVAHEDAPRRDYYNHHNAIEKRDAFDASQQHSSTSHSDSDS